MNIVKKLATGMNAGKYADALEVACGNWGITDPNDQARFIAQLHVESGAFARIEESTAYRGPRLFEVFKGRNGLNSLAEANLICKAGPKTVANFIYGGEWGRKNLGNTLPDDGWNFRGRSLIQTTGRYNYERTSIGCFGDRRLLTNPDLLLLPENAASAAAWYWYSQHLNGVDDVRAVTKKINAGLMHLDERIKQTSRALNLVTFLTGKP